MLKLNRKIILFILVVALVQGFTFPLVANAFSVAVVSDIHADGKKKISMGGENVFYPKKYKLCLDEMKALKPDLVVVSGDLADKGKKKYYKSLRDEMQGTQTLWAKGNHDGKNFKLLAVENYYTDFQGWRFIVLDSSAKFGSSTGFLEDFQISLLEEWLKTDKNVAIVMHHPPFFYNSRSGIYTSERVDPYDVFFDALTPNVKYVFSGHWHFDKRVDVDGTTFLIQKALTQGGNCNYSILDLENGTSEETETEEELRNNSDDL